VKDKTVRVKSWEEMRRLIILHHPRSVIYNIEKGVPAGNLENLRIILPTRGTQYVFIDSAAGDSLRKTGVKLHKDKSGKIYVRDEDVASFVKSESGIEDLNVYSYWTI